MAVSLKKLKSIIFGCASLALLGSTTAVHANIYKCSTQINDSSYDARFGFSNGQFTSFDLSMNRVVNQSPHECAISSRKGDNMSRWASDESGSFARIEDADTGTFRLSFLPEGETWFLAIQGSGMGDVTCGSFTVPRQWTIKFSRDGKCILKTL